MSENDSKAMNNKDDMMAAYNSYCSAVRELEIILKCCPPRLLAEMEFQLEYKRSSREFEFFPWDVSPIDDERRQVYQDMSDKKFPEDLGNYCYISLGNTSLEKMGEKEFVTAPTSKASAFDFVFYPTPYDHYYVVHEPDLKLKDTVFVVGGKSLFQYGLDCDDVLLSEAMSDIKFSEKLQSLLHLSTVTEDYPELYHQSKDDKKFTQIVKETFSSVFLKDLESMMLNVLGYTAENGRNLLRGVFPHGDCLEQAEQNHFILSAERFKDYINIRHLLHHQADTVITSDCNNDRAELLQSYNKVCGKSLRERVNGYAEALCDFRQLTQKFYPNLLFRQQSESNSKFVERIKAYCKENAVQDLILELNYPFAHDKCKRLTKNIHKVFPNATIIDNPDFDIETLQFKMESYKLRSHFLMKFQHVERAIRFYCLSEGKALQKQQGVDFLVEKGILDKKEAARLNDLRLYRNVLSHNLLTDEMADDLRKNFIDYYNTAEKLRFKINQNIPGGQWLHDNVFRFEHPDGRVVDVDFSQRKVLGVYLPQAVESQRIEHAQKESQAKKSEKENLQNVHLSNGAKIDFDTQKIALADGAVLFFNSDALYCLSLRSGKQCAKVLIDKKDMTVKSCIVNGSRLPVQRGDSISVSSSYRLIFDKQCRLSKYIYTDENGQKQEVLFSAGGYKKIKFADGSAIDLSTEKPTSLLSPLLLAQKNQGRK